MKHLQDDDSWSGAQYRTGSPLAKAYFCMPSQFWIFHLAYSPSLQTFKNVLTVDESFRSLMLVHQSEELEEHGVKEFKKLQETQTNLRKEDL